jgi:hypothetical protein
MRLGTRGESFQLRMCCDFDMTRSGGTTVCVKCSRDGSDLTRAAFLQRDRELQGIPVGVSLSGFPS